VLTKGSVRLVFAALVAILSISACSGGGAVLSSAPSAPGSAGMPEPSASAAVRASQSGRMPAELMPAEAAPMVSRPVGIAGLHVVGNEILNSVGKRFVPHGIDRSGTEYMCVQDNGIFDGPNHQTAVSAMLKWHIDAVRVPLNEDCWLAINGVPPAYSGANYQNAIVKFVNLLNANGIVAILDLHWSAPGSQLATGQEPMADADHSPTFWTSVAATFKRNESVIFDLYNEPEFISWSCWLNGGTASACGTSFTLAGMNSLVAAVRSTGATNVLMAGGVAYANDLSQWLQNKPTDPTGNLAASWHVYNFNTCNTKSCYNSTVGVVAASVPVIAGEIGENDCADGFIDALMPWLDAHHSGYLGWAWNADFACSTGPSLITNYDGTPTPFGIGLKNHLAKLDATPVLQ
jgi:hypothetical protein